MNIREANKFDIPYFIEMINRINDDESLGEIYLADLDESYLNALFASVLAGAGVCYIAENDEPIGIILGIISPNVWAPKYLAMHEVLYYVDEDYRKTRAGYMLFKAFDNKANKMLEEKRIHALTLSVPKTIIDMDFERFDYEQTEKVWTKKGHRHG